LLDDELKLVFSVCGMAAVGRDISGSACGKGVKRLTRLC